LKYWAVANTLAFYSAVLNYDRKKINSIGLRVEGKNDPFIEIVPQKPKLGRFYKKN
jgi:hypothetical protein